MAKKFLKKPIAKSTVSIELPMSEGEALEASKFIEMVGSYLSFSDWKKLDKALKTPGVKTILLSKLKNL